MSVPYLKAMEMSETDDSCDLNGISSQFCTQKKKSHTSWNLRCYIFTKMVSSGSEQVFDDLHAVL